MDDVFIFLKTRMYNHYANFISNNSNTLIINKVFFIHLDIFEKFSIFANHFCCGQVFN